VKIWVGCCGLAGLSWKDYESRFEAIEIQSTFYRLPRLSTAKSWREQAPKLRFTVKAWQGVTHPTTSPTWRRAGTQRPAAHEEGYGHLQPTRNVFKAWQSTLEVCRELNAEACLIQLPPSFDMRKEHIENMVGFFEQIERTPVIAIEFRHDSWYRDQDELSRLLKRLRLTHVVDPLTQRAAHMEGVAYYRLHGRRLPGGRLDYRYRYTDDEIVRIKREVERSGGDRAYVFFNNLSMRDDAMKLLSLL
jgi:uncharacterized protein YecE (DUF72 family)